MNESKPEKLQQAMQTCRHFNGVQNDACQAGVVYDEVQPAGHHLPCLPHLVAKSKSKRPMGICDKCTFPTEEEARADLAEIDRAVTEALSHLAAGRCHHCKQDAGREVVGRCAYCKGCGQRIGQVQR